MVEISVAGSTEQACVAAAARICTASAASAPKLMVSILAPAAAASSRNCLHVVGVLREGVRGEEHAVGHVAGAPHHRGVEAVDADDDDVAEARGIELLEQRLRLRHHHRGEQHLRLARSSAAISLTWVEKSASARLYA